jgi:hypothetical protein
MLQVRGSVVTTRRGDVLMGVAAGRGAPGTDARRAQITYRVLSPVQVPRGQTLKVRGLMRVRQDGDVYRTVIVVDGRDIEILPVPGR